MLDERGYSFCFLRVSGNHPYQKLVVVLIDRVPVSWNFCGKAEDNTASEHRPHGAEVAGNQQQKRETYVKPELHIERPHHASGCSDPFSDAPPLKVNRSNASRTKIAFIGGLAHDVIKIMKPTTAAYMGQILAIRRSMNFARLSGVSIPSLSNIEAIR
jgi:hypothetical protein